MDLIETNIREKNVACDVAAGPSDFILGGRVYRRCSSNISFAAKMCNKCPITCCNIYVCVLARMPAHMFFLAGIFVMYNVLC